MPADFFAVTSAGIAHILRLWALQEGFYIYIFDFHIPRGLFMCYQSTPSSV